MNIYDFIDNPFKAVKAPTPPVIPDMCFRCKQQLVDFLCVCSGDFCGV